MHDDPIPRELPERTGRHYCVRCMAIVGAEEYQRNDHICDACAADEEYPLASTPEPKSPDGKPDAKKKKR
jgi:hypothetical protein